MSELKMETTKTVYSTLCRALDDMKLSYKKFEEDFVVTFGYKGEDMNHDFLIAVNADQEVIQFVVRLPFKINAEMAADIASAVCYANDNLLLGNFIYDMQEEIIFELTQVYTDCTIGGEAISRMIASVAVSVERFDDKFMDLSKGYLKPEDFKE